MYKLIIAVVTAALLAGCTTAERDAATGAAAGAAIAAVATGGRPGAIAVGALAGGATAVLIGAAARKGECRYRTSKGRIYVAKCPAGYY